MRATKSSQAGFTLIELMVVVLIIGLLSTIAVPVLNRAIAKSHRTSTAASMVELYSAMTRYYADNGAFPVLDTVTFEPLVSGGYLESPDSLLSKFHGNKVFNYINFGGEGWWIVVHPKGDSKSWIYAGRVLIGFGPSISGINWDGVYWYRDGETAQLSRIDGSQS